MRCQITPLLEELAHDSSKLGSGGLFELASTTKLKGTLLSYQVQIRLSHDRETTSVPYLLRTGRWSLGQGEGTRGASLLCSMTWPSVLFLPACLSNTHNHPAYTFRTALRGPHFCSSTRSLPSNSISLNLGSSLSKFSSGAL